MWWLTLEDCLPPIAQTIETPFFKSAGFGGLAAVFASIIAAIVAGFGIRWAWRQHTAVLAQQEKLHTKSLSEQERQHLAALGAQGRHHEQSLALQREQHEATLGALERDRQIARIWDRLTWLTDVAFNNGLPPTFVNELLAALTKEARALGDRTLVIAIRATDVQFVRRMNG